MSIAKSCLQFSAISNDMSNYPKLCLSDNGVCVHILPSKSNSEEKEENSLGKKIQRIFLLCLLL